MHEYQRRMKYNHVKTAEVMNMYYNLYKTATDRGDNPGIILRISQQYDVTPCLVAKLILQKYLNDVNLINSDNDSSTQTNIKTYLRDTTLIQDPSLAYEVYLVRIK